MKTHLILLGLSLVLAVTACGRKPSAAPLATPASTPAASAVPAAPVVAGLFVETKEKREASSAPHVARQRLVRLDLSLLLAPDGQPLDLKAGGEITLNLFPDTTYTGVIVQIEQNADDCSWVGYLKGVEFSQMTLVYTGGLFIANISSPEGVYEVSTLGDDLYRIIQIDQTKLPGGEG